MLLDALSFVRNALHSHRQLAAENLFLRKQLALYIERQTKPRRATDGTRLTLVMRARFIDWRPVLTIVRPTHWCAGTARRFGCCGAGNLVPLGSRRYPRRSSS